jgi:hypothetical protein
MYSIGQYNFYQFCVSYFLTIRIFCVCSSGSVIHPQPPMRRGPLIMQGPGPDGNHTMENTGRYPEYKH